MDTDYQTALLLQAQLDYENSNLSNKNSKQSDKLSDSLLAKNLQDQYNQENNTESPKNFLTYDKKTKKSDGGSLVDPSWEIVDPTPDVHILFVTFNSRFFWDKLGAVRVTWSKQMKRCAGICSYNRAGGCHISLSEPLLKLRPRKDLVETLLHEMIHAYLFLTNNNRDRDGHGPEFHKHMFRINKEAGTNITVYHSFHDEVELYLQHWWRCDGPCQKWKPYFGIVRRSMNRAPGPNDRWFGEHSRNCGGTFVKIREPEKKPKASKKNKENVPVSSSNSTKDIRNYFNKTSPTKPTLKHPELKVGNANKLNNVHSFISDNNVSVGVTINSKVNNIHGFAKSSSDKKLANKNNGQTIAAVNTKKNNDNTLVKTNESFTSDYEIVRNHWLNKFSNNKASTSKRQSSESLNYPTKIPKVDPKNSSKIEKDVIVLDDSLNDKVPCPVCNSMYLIDELNTHLDNCLTVPKIKECIICLKNIDESVYEQHVNKCINKNDEIINLDEDSMNLDEVKCEICSKMVNFDFLEKHLEICDIKTCDMCNKSVTKKDYDVHVEKCLLDRMDNLEQELRDNSEMISCLACGKNIVKLKLNSHLEECMSISQVFDDFDEDDKTNEVSASNDIQDCLVNEYNCPICLKLFNEQEMNAHIDTCLQFSDIGKLF